MTNTRQTHHIIASAQALTIPNRPGDRQVEIPADLPGVVIYIHGVNDPGAAYENVEKGLCQGLNERLSRVDLTPGEYGQAYRAEKAKKGLKGVQDDILNDPDTYLYMRSEVASTTRSVFLPFYWGYRAASNEIAKVNAPGEVRSRTADQDGNLMTRGQYQDRQGNRLDAHFAKAGGFFGNATNNIPDMYGAGFRAPAVGEALTYTGATGNYTYIADGPQRRYFVLAAERLAALISTIRTIEASDAAKQACIIPEHETITIMGHSQGTLIALLAQAILAQRGERCADCLIMVDSPYSVQETHGSKQTARARLKTLMDIVHEVTQSPYPIPLLDHLTVSHEWQRGRAGHDWTPEHGKRRDKDGKTWISFDERDNRGKVYLYFCPEDTATGMRDIRGIGTFGIPDEIETPKSRNKLQAMNELKDKRFFQRMWTLMERDHGDGKRKKVPVGMPEAHVPVREPLERLLPGPDTGVAGVVGTFLQAPHERHEMRLINGEALKPQHEPDLYGGEVVRGAPRPGHADQAGKFAPDDVSMDVALGNQDAQLVWKTVEHTLLPPLDLGGYRNAFNANRPVDRQSQNWRIVPRLGIPGFTVEREETPDEARERMKTDPHAYDDNSYHSAILNSPENHRWVTAMDVAIGQAVSLDDPDWRDLLIRMADWRLTTAAMTPLQANPNYGRLNERTKNLIEATATYYQKGIFPDESVVPLKTMPPLVTSETYAQRDNPPPVPLTSKVDLGGLR
ncbi:T6SS effector phospholipase Tle3 domain-containing protein [Paraburkholderia caffeinilytica]|uniref:T6SS effector phospholipase Tle3 domain-containing protein n=1 Tax=Paraburkholderia caffeinilytica TaxID=1761016 RepID=UPI003DA0A0F0